MSLTHPLSKHPAIGKTVLAGGIQTNFHEAGAGFPVILLHGSGAGITGWENWREIMPLLAARYHVLVPDIIGFGFTERPEGTEYGIKLWVTHLLAFMDALGIQKAVLVGNSFGGALALATATRYAHRVERMVLMGTPAGDFTREEKGGSSWYYEPTMENMEELLLHFPYDPSYVTKEMVRQRYEVTLMAGGMEAYRKLFPEPSKAGEARVVHGISESLLAKIDTPIRVLHGRDDKMIPMGCGLLIAKACPNADLHLFGKCGHWVQIERRDDFVNLTQAFLRDLG